MLQEDGKENSEKVIHLQDDFIMSPKIDFAFKLLFGELIINRVPIIMGRGCFFLFIICRRVISRSK